MALRASMRRQSIAHPSGRVDLLRASKWTSKERTVKSTAPISHVVEYGSGPRIASPLRAKAMLINGDFVRGHVVSTMPERPFMRPAAEAGKPKIEEAVKEAIKK